jgi:hypothetical protein
MELDACVKGVLEQVWYFLFHAGFSIGDFGS